MAQFLGDLAFLLEMALLAAGLVLLHRARQERGGLLRLAGACSSRPASVIASAAGTSGSATTDRATSTALRTVAGAAEAVAILEECHRGLSVELHKAPLRARL